MTSTTDTSGYETLSSGVLSGKGKRFKVEASDDYVVGGRKWHVRIWEIRQEAGRGDVNELRMCSEVADRNAAVALAEQVVAKVQSQLA